MTNVLLVPKGLSMLTDRIGAVATTQDFSTSRGQLAQGS
jgi:hypothetical protein